VKGSGSSTFIAGSTFFKQPGMLPEFLRKSARLSDFCVYPFQLTDARGCGLRWRITVDRWISLTKTAKRMTFRRLRIV